MIRLRLCLSFFSFRLRSISESCCFLSSIIFFICAFRLFSLSSKIASLLSSELFFAELLKSSFFVFSFVLLFSKASVSTDPSDVFAPQKLHAEASSGICAPHTLHIIYSALRFIISFLYTYNYILFCISNQYHHDYISVTIKRQFMYVFYILPVFTFRYNKIRTLGHAN